MADTAENAALETGAIYAALAGLGLMDEAEKPLVTPLTGGVSSDICRVDLRSGPVCVKRALAKLKVEQDWFVSVERNAYEVAYMRCVGAIAPKAVPKLIAQDSEAGLFVMEYLPPDSFPLWKSQLRDGAIEPAVAGELGLLMAQIHAATANKPRIAEEFAGATPLFYDIRLEPYLLATAEANADCSDRLQRLAIDTARIGRALVHGDFSPKNILIGPDGPVLLDSEACCYGDPAFDLAFCLNHLLLKCVWRPQWKDRYLACFDALAGAYLGAVAWEPAGEVELRAARLLSAFILARIDGKSPAEYITEAADKARIRKVAKRLILANASSLAIVRETWAMEFAS